MNRIEKMQKNIFWGAFSNVVIMLLSFVSRTVFIYNLSATELGVNGVFSNILTILSFTELGIGTAMNYSLYGLVAKKDTKKIKSLMYFYKKAYMVIAGIVAFLGIVLIPFLPYIAKGTEGVDNLYAIYFLYLFNTVASYFVSYKYSLSNAEQKNYIFTNINLVFNIICTCTQMLSVIIFKNFFIYCLVGAIVQLIQNITTTIYMNKLYPFLKEKDVEPISKEDLAPIVKNVKALIISKIGSICVNQTDNLIISMAINVTVVGIISNYLTLTRNVSQFLNLVFNAGTASFGNLIATEGKEKQYKMFCAFRFLAFWSYGFASIALLVLMTPFVSLLWGAENTIGFAVIFWICINYYFAGHRICVYNVKVAGGLFNQDKFLAFATAIVNLVVSIIGAKYFGPAGVYFGTFVTGLIETFVRPQIIYKNLFDVDVKHYYIDGIKYFITVVAAAVICYWLRTITMPEINIIGFIINMAIVVIIPNFIFFVFFGRREEFAYLKKIVMDKINSIKFLRKFRHFMYLVVWKVKDVLTKPFIKNPTIKSIEETYEKIINDKVSVSRFGDGEFKWMEQIPQNSFQEENELMRQRLIEISKSDKDNHIICLSDTFGSLKKYNKYAREFWGTFMGMYRKKWIKFLNLNKVYYNTNMTRPYMDYVDKSQCKKRFDMLKRIWEGKDILIVEGEKTRLGIGNDLFESASSIKRILAPATNAFGAYEDLINAVLEHNKDCLVLIALGPTATILAYDLADKGYQAIDIGHVDIEYEWFLMGATEKVPIKNKYVNESLEGRDIGVLDDTTYISQIVKRVTNSK